MNPPLPLSGIILKRVFNSYATFNRNIQVIYNSLFKQRQELVVLNFGVYQRKSPAETGASSIHIWTYVTVLCFRPRVSLWIKYSTLVRTRICSISLHKRQPSVPRHFERKSFAPFSATNTRKTRRSVRGHYIYSCADRK